MKRMFLVLTVLLCTTVNVLAQEVHGVETKMVCTYDCNPNGSWSEWNWKYPWFGYQFTNLNSIPVSVEAELYYRDTYGNELISTKYFVLESGESYVFKYMEQGISTYQNHTKYYVKYKAYKLL